MASPLFNSEAIVREQRNLARSDCIPFRKVKALFHFDAAFATGSKIQACSERVCLTRDSLAETMVSE